MPEPAAATLRQATTLVEIRRYNEAMGLLGRLIAAEPGAAGPRCLLAQCHLGLDDPAGALAAATGQPRNLSWSGLIAFGPLRCSDSTARRRRPWRLVKR